MKKLIDGILDFRARILPTCREKFRELAKGQHPDALFITCSDSRVAPNWFASTDPGDLFVIRNVGNMIPKSGRNGVTLSDESELAAVEFAVQALQVSDIVICGHSECGAMHAIESNKFPPQTPHLHSWLRHGEASLQKLEAGKSPDTSLSRVNQLSQLNVLQQLENLRSYPMIEQRVQAGKLKLHAWWFDIANAEIKSFRESKGRFVLIGEEESN